MKIIHEYPIKVFSKDFNGNKIYSIGISKKDIKGNYINGYLDARFRKDTPVDTDKKIYIKDAWLDFYLDKDNKTRPYIFINKFEYVSEFIKEAKEENDPWADLGNKINTEDIILEDKDLPF